MSERNCKYCNDPVNRQNKGFVCAGPCQRKFHPLCGKMPENLINFKDTKGFYIMCNQCSADSNAHINISDSTIVNGLHEKLERMQDDVSSIKNFQVQFSTSLQHFNDVIEDFRAEMKNFKEEINTLNALKNELAILKQDHAKVNVELQGLQQYMRRENVEIIGVAENRSENLMQVICSIGNHVGCPIQQTDIAACHRVAHSASSNTKSRSIIAKFVNRFKKEEFVTACRKRKGFSGKDVNINNCNDPLYVNDHLTIENKNLLRQTRELCKQKNYKFVWVRECKILVRKNEGSRIIHIENGSSLQRIQ